MKRWLYSAVWLSLVFWLGCEPATKVSENETGAIGDSGWTQVIDQTVDAACGECQFDMEGTGCELAVQIDGQSYFVDGSSIDDHGDAHGSDGMCNCVRQARVSGEIREGRFVARSFEILPWDGGQQGVEGREGAAH